MYAQLIVKHEGSTIMFGDYFSIKGIEKLVKIDERIGVDSVNILKNNLSQSAELTKCLSIFASRNNQ